MLDELTGVVTRLGQASAVHDVVQTRLEDLQQNLTGLARLAVGLFVVPAELPLQHAVDAAGLLLLTQLQQVLGLLGTATAVLPRRERPGLERALGPIALAALEEQLLLLTTATTAVGTCITSHILYLP